MVDGGDMDCGGGLLLMIRAAFEPVPPGGVIEIRSRESSVREDLPAWCRMVGHELLSAVEAPGSYIRFLVRKKGVQTRDPSLVEHLDKARDYVWKVRAKSLGGTRCRVFARNHTFEVGQPASFNTEDEDAGALEYLLGALAACLLVGFEWRLGQAGVRLQDAEIALSGKPENVLVFLGIEHDGSPGLKDIQGKLFARTADPATPDDILARVWDETLKRSPVYQSLRAVGVHVEFRRLP